MGVSGGSSNQSSQSNSYGYSSNLAESINASNVWGAQTPALTQGYKAASDLAASQQPAVTDAATRYGAQGYADSQAGTGALRDLAAGGGPLAAYATPNNALAKDQLAAMTADIGQQFRESILPGIRSSAGQVGGIGGSREALARGAAAGDAARAIGSAATNLYAQQYATGAQAAAGQTDAMLSAGQALPGAAASSYNLGMMPFQSAWGPIASLMSAIGGPTVLSQGVSRAQSASENWGNSTSSGKSSQFGLSLF